MKVLKNEPLKQHTSFRVGGPAKVYVVPEEIEELQKLIHFLQEEELSYDIIGNGTNLLVSDAGVDHVVVEIGRALEGIELLPEANASDATSSLRASSSSTGSAKSAAPEAAAVHTTAVKEQAKAAIGTESKPAAGSAAMCATSEAAAVNATAADEKTYYIRVLAGTLLSKAAQFAATQELCGMEALRGIPGTIGGAVTMNAGAYGTEMKDVLYSVDVLTPEGELRTLTPAELALGYRHSVIPERGYVVVAATLALRKGDAAEIQARMADFQNRRKEKQPLDKASAGSTFKRPEGYFAGKLIEDTGLRGFRHGGAQVSEKHCGFVINDGTARAADIYWLIGEVRKRVLLEQHVELTPEVKLWGEF